MHIAAQESFELQTIRQHVARFALIGTYAQQYIPVAWCQDLATSMW